MPTLGAPGGSARGANAALLAELAELAELTALAAGRPGLCLRGPANGAAVAARVLAGRSVKDGPASLAKGVGRCCIGEGAPRFLLAQLPPGRSLC